MNKDIEKFEGFLSEEDFKIVHEDAYSKVRPMKDCGNLSTFKTNYTIWDKRIVDQSSIVLVHDIIDQRIVDILNRSVKVKFNNLPVSYMYYYWTNGSYIPWHEDGHATHAGTLYLNEKWDRNWGGYYMYESNDGNIKALKPESNLFVLQHNSTPHCTTATTQGSDIRVSVQMFFK